MKLLIENWRRFLNEAFVSGEPKEVYKKIQDWVDSGSKGTFGVTGPSATQLGLKNSRSGRTVQQHVQKMLSDLENKLEKIESMGGITIHYKEVSPGDLFPYFDVETEGSKSKKVQETGLGKAIMLVYNPDDKTAQVTFKSNDAFEWDPKLPFIDPTTGDVKGVEPRKDEDEIDLKVSDNKEL